MNIVYRIKYAHDIEMKVHVRSKGWFVRGIFAIIIIKRQNDDDVNDDDEYRTE